MIEEINDLKKYVIICNSLKELKDLCLYLSLDKKCDVSNDFYNQTEDKIYFVKLNEDSGVFNIINYINNTHKVLNYGQFIRLTYKKEFNTTPFKCDENGRIIEITDIMANRLMYKLVYNKNDNNLMTCKEIHLALYGIDCNKCNRCFWSSMWNNEEYIRTYETVNKQIKKDICFESKEKLYQYMTKVYNELLGNNKF